MDVNPAALPAMVGQVPLGLSQVSLKALFISLKALFISLKALNTSLSMFVGRSFRVKIVSPSSSGEPREQHQRHQGPGKRAGL